MGFLLKRNLIYLAALFLIVVVLAEEATTPANSEEEDDSSSEETVEDSNESRRKRSLESLDVPESASVDGGGGGGGGAGALPRISIPGLPDPATILKIAEILQAVGEQVIPILVEGNPTQGLVADRIGRDFKFLRNFKQELDLFAENLKMK